MSDHDSSFLSFMSTDDLRWLNAYDTLLQEPSSPISIPVKAPTVSTVPINDSLTLLRAKGMGHHRYQSSTKSSHAKSVQSKLDSCPRTSNAIRPATPVPSPGARRIRTTSIRNGLRPNKSSSARSPQQEWIYRRPKSPAATRAAPGVISRPANISSPTRPSRRPATGYFPLSPQSNTSPLWTSVLRSRNHADRSPKGVSLSQLKLDTSSSIAKPLSPVSDNSSPTSTNSPTSSSSSTPSSRPDTPTSSHVSHSPVKNNRKINQRRYRDISFDSTSSTNTLTGRLPSQFKSTLPVTSSNKRLQDRSPTTSSLSTARKNSVGTTGSNSSKSVKFVELPTVHYASVGYWDLESGMNDDVMMGIDLESMELEEPSIDISSSHADGTDVDIFAPDGPPWMHPGMHKRYGSPLPDNHLGALAHEKPSAVKRFTSLRRGSTSRSSIPVPVKPRPVISGPLVLGYRPTASPPPSRPNRSTISLRNAPSVESFRSAKSGGAKSTRSLASLKSLPASLKSTITLNARGLREWIKERVVGLEIGVVG